MNRPLLFAASLLLLPFVPAADAAKPAADGHPRAVSPAEQLMPYINHIDQLLALQRNLGPKLAPLANQAPGRLAVLKASYVERRSKAEGTEAASLTAAIATCDTLTAALDERQKTLGQIKANAAVKGTGDLGRQRKDNFSEGPAGQELPRTADVIEQARRERANNRELQQHAAQTDRAMTSAAANRWNQRSIELRQQVTAAYARIGQT